MVERFDLGGEHETESGDTRHRYFIEVSAPLLNQLSTIELNHDISVREALSGVIEAGSVEAFEEQLEQDES